MRHRKEVFAALLVFLSGDDAARATEGESALCTFTVVHALSDARACDPRLDGLCPRLQRAPFQSWTTFEQLSKKAKHLAPKTSAEFALPKGRAARVFFLGNTIRADGNRGLHAALSLEGRKSTARAEFTIDDGGSLLVAGRPYERGILIYALSCTTEH